MRDFLFNKHKNLIVTKGSEGAVIYNKKIKNLIFVKRSLIL